MIRRGWFLLVAAGMANAGCSQDAPLPRRHSVVELADPYDTTVRPLDLPDTVHRGVPFVVTFVTVGYPLMCWRPDGEIFATQGRQVRITPWEVYVLPDGEAGPCDLEQLGPRSTTVTLDAVGVDTIRVVGRVDPYSVPDFEHVLDSVSASVVVVP